MVTLNTTYNMYIIYLTDNQLCEKYNIDSQLYAFTRDKKMAKAFISQRNNKFKLKKKEVSIQEWKYLENKYLKSYLTTFDCETSGTDKNNKIMIEKLPVVMTEKEKNEVINIITRMIYNGIVPDCYNTFKIFEHINVLKLKYISSLVNLKFIGMDEKGKLWGSITTGRLHFDFLKLLALTYSDLF